MKNKGTAYRILSVYAIVNVIYLMCFLVIWIINLIIPLTIPNALNFLAVFPISLILYLLIKLPFVHIIYYIVYLKIFAVRFKAEKSKARIISTIVLSLSGILLNTFWWINGQPFLVN